MIDIHSHILPGLDDGAEDMKESLMMLDMARRQGITDVIATPHYSGYFHNYDPQIIRKLCGKVQNEAEKRRQPLVRIWPGQEIMYSEDSLQKLQSGRLLTLADSRHVLIEFIPYVPYSYILNAVQNLTENGYHPILAHVERYQILNEFEKIDRLKKAGAFLQINYRSVGGRWYAPLTRWCRQMLRVGLVDFLGTDMHNTDTRKPEVKAAAEWIYKKLPLSYASEILERNPRKIISNEKK